MNYNPLYGFINSIHPSIFTTDGGLLCLNELSSHYRLSITLLSSLIQLSIVYKLLPSQSKQYPSMTPSISKPIRILLSLPSLLTYFIIWLYKMHSLKGIYMLNPCHIMLLLQSICIIHSPSPSLNILFNIMMRLLNGSLCALVFPDLSGLDLPYE